MSAVCTGRYRSRRRSLISDRRGAAAFEMAIIYLFLMFSLLLPLADLAMAGFQYMSAWQALRAFGQYLQYNQPPDVTDASSWMLSAITKADPKYPVQAIQLVCGDNNFACSSSNPDSTDSNKPKYYVYSTTITLTPMVLRSALCKSDNTDPCSYTLPYSEQFQ